MKALIYILSPFRAGVFSLLIIFSSSCYAQIITTIAGIDTSGYNGDGIAATMAQLDQPGNVAVDMAGNIFIADAGNNRIRKINASGIISTIAGTGIAGYSGDNGPASVAQLNGPIKIALDTFGNLYIADGHNNCIRRISSSGIITTFAGTGVAGYNGDGIQATVAQLNIPGSMAVDRNGNVFIADVINNRIRKVNSSGVISTIAGTGAIGFSGDGGPATAAKLRSPIDIAVDQDGIIYFIDYLNGRVRKIDLSGTISTIAGVGVIGYSGNGSPATSAMLNGPFGITIDNSGNIYIAEDYNHVVRIINASGIINVFAGNGSNGYSGDGGPPLLAEFKGPYGVSLDKNKNMYITDFHNGTVRFIRNTVSANSISEPTMGISVYPNPCKGEFTINVTSVVEETMHLTITGVDANLIKDFTFFTNRPLNVKLDERSGLYIVFIATSQGVKSVKLIVAK